jgi:large subunit ribosomal protein L36
LAGRYQWRSKFKAKFRGSVMKIVRSLKTIKSRDKNCQVVRRRGKVYVINKKKRRYKARQA